MIKFENGMLVLNNAFSKEDVNQINEFAESVRKEERERIIKLLEQMASVTLSGDTWHYNPFTYAIALIKGE